MSEPSTSTRTFTPEEFVREAKILRSRRYNYTADLLEFAARKLGDRAGVKSAERKLLIDIKQQYQRRLDMFTDACGDPANLRGSMTCYLDFELLRLLFEPSAKEVKS